jgi:gamma-glutamyl:cysteine ligase YbdK (ATP-grasp superfamily)
LEKEKSRIEKTLKLLDKKEIELWNSQEQITNMVKDNKLEHDHEFFKKPIEYFKFIQHSLYQVMLENKKESPHQR